MPRVASEATTYASKPALPNPTRAAPSSDRASSSPFDSLIDDGTQAPASPQSPPASADKTAAQPDSAAEPAAKTNGTKAAQAKGDSKAANMAIAPGAADATNAIDAGNAAETDSIVTKGKVPSDGKVKAAVKLVEQAKAGDDSKPAGDGKPAEGPAPTFLAADPATGMTQIVTPAVAVAIAPAPAAVVPAGPGAIAQVSPTALAQTVAAVQPALVAAGTPKAKAIDPATPQADSGKSAEDPKLSAKTTFNLQSDGKPQTVAGDADKPAAHPHDEVPAATHHASAETLPPIVNDGQAATPKTAGDVAQQALLTPPSQDVSQAPTNPTAPAPPAAQAAAVPLAGVAIEIAGMALAGKNHFEIRLDPPELGRIEVRLDVDRDGHVTSRLIADRSDTLDLLRRDATGLERALQDAGLKTADNGLQFSLRDQTMGRQQSNTPAPPLAQIVVNDSALPTNDAIHNNYSRLAGLRGGIDIRV